MHTATPSHHRSTVRATLVAATILVVSAVMGASPTDASSTQQAAPRPRLVHGAVADVLVRVYGSKACSGTPITGTRYVVTAAHCVLDRDGEAAAATVARDGVTYPAVAVLVDDHYLDAPTAQLDAAVLVMGQVMPDPSATVGAAIPTTDALTIAGLQSLDSDGTLLRGKHPHDRLTPNGVTGTYIKIASAPAGCTVPIASLSLRGNQVDVPCGLIPGASGGGLFAEVDGTIVLVGIISTVTFDQSANGVVPLDSLHELLRHPQRYRHDLTATHSTRTHQRVVLS
jgi:hypothetical protein